MFSSGENESLGLVFRSVGFRFDTFDEPLSKCIKRADMLETRSPEKKKRVYLVESHRFKIVPLLQGQGRPNSTKSLETLLRKAFLGQYFIFSIFYRGSNEVEMEVKSRRRGINFAFSELKYRN